MPQKIKKKVPGEMTGRMMDIKERSMRENAMTKELEAMRKARGGVNITEMEDEEETPGTKKVVGVVMTNKPKFNKLMKEKLLKIMSEKKIPGPKSKFTPSKEQTKKTVEEYGSYIKDIKDKIPGPKSKFMPSKEDVKKTINKFKNL